MKGTKEIRRITLINITANTVLAGVKITCGFLFFSPALIADGFHSFSDLTTDIAVVFAFGFARRPKDKTHPYGHGKIENVANIFIAMILVYAAISIFRSSYDFLKDGRTVVPHFINLIVALASVATKEVMYRMNLAVGESIKSETLITNAWHHRTDAFSSIAVALGIGLGLFDRRLVIADPILGFIIALLIAYIGLKIILDTGNKIIDRNIPEDMQKEIRHHVKTAFPVHSVHKIRGRYYGSRIIIDFHIELDPKLTLKKAHTITHEVEHSLKEAFPDIQDIIIHTEPIK